MWISSVIIATVVVTSLLSGILGMAGGMVLMAVLLALGSVAKAMIIHGVVQATSNGSRAYFLRGHIEWHILPPYMIGAAAALAAFTALVLVPDASIVLIIVGVLPWLARLVPRLHGLDVTRPITAVTCGLVVTAAQLFAGASGPILDVFYLNSPLTRYQIVASKALTQTIGHLIKLVYYGLIIGVEENLSPWFLGAAIAAAVLGSRVGTRLLDRFSDEHFRRVTGYVILGIGVFCVVNGVRGLIVGTP
jgi:uncharacterized membrane protein YfcA